MRESDAQSLEIMGRLCTIVGGATAANHDN
jgi:hypothetical protein